MNTIPEWLDRIDREICDRNTIAFQFADWLDSQNHHRAEDVRMLADGLHHNIVGDHVRLLFIPERVDVPVVGGDADGSVLRVRFKRSHTKPYLPPSQSINGREYLLTSTSGETVYAPDWHYLIMLDRIRAAMNRERRECKAVEFRRPKPDLSEFESKG